MAAKPRCPRCGAVSRKLYHRLANDKPFQAVDDAAECPACGAFLTRDHD